MIFNNLELNDNLPLTCTLEGTCCFGNNVYINPWEIYNLSKGLKIQPQDFIHFHTTDGGIKLAFKGKYEKPSKKSCNLYDEKKGCSVHHHRPLACRLFPLGRRIQSNKTSYFFEGKNHPCLERCPSALDLPKLKLIDYIKQQKTANFEIVQEQYLDILQNIADTAFALYLETEAKLKDKGKTIKGWKNLTKKNNIEIGNLFTTERKKIILYPFDLNQNYDEKLFIENHISIIEQKIQEEINQIENLDEIISYSIHLIAISIFIGKSIGADMDEILKKWIDDAKEFSKQ